MATPKPYAGPKLRETRTRLGLTQKAFADRLGVSLPYLNQMENNHRPLSAQVIEALSKEFGLQAEALGTGERDRLAADLAKALTDPVFAKTAAPMGDLQQMAAHAPAMARAFLDLHTAYQSLKHTPPPPQATTQPWQEVEAFFRSHNTYFDEIDRLAERFAPDAAKAAQPALEAKGFRVQFADIDTPSRRNGATLTLAQSLSAASQGFELLRHLAELLHPDLLDRTIAQAGLGQGRSRDLARRALARYFAAAALMPYRRFLEAARDYRYDIERLAQHFGASPEQVAHRLTTLHRDGETGAGFFLMRVDHAGNITKRYGAEATGFAQKGGGCPLWIAHHAFETPNRFLTQLAAVPDGGQYLFIAKEITKTGGSFHSPSRRYVLCLGCAARHAKDITYADRLQPEDPSRYAAVGLDCRNCARRHCPQRAHPQDIGSEHSAKPPSAPETAPRQQQSLLPFDLN